MDDTNWKEMFDSIWKREGNNFIQFVLDAGLDVNALNKYGKTLLSNAAGFGNLEMINFLVNKGADFNATNSDGSKPLHTAAKYGHKDVVEFFLDGGVFVDSCDNKNSTPLHYAAAKPNIPVADRESYRELVHFLVDRNANLNAVNVDGHTPLLLAAHNSCKLVFETFIELGADVNLFGKRKWGALHYACRRGFSDVVKSLVSKSSDLNAKTSDGDTPLSVAADYKHLNIVEFLIGSGADVEVCDEEGWTILHWACRRGWLGVVKSLVSKGCDLNASTSDGHTPLLVAADYAQLSIVDYLIQSGADVKRRSEDGYTLLHFACLEGWLDVVKYLVSKNSDLNAEADCGETPLHFAIQNCDLDIIEYLLNAGKIGAYLTLDDYFAVTEEPFLKEGILQDTELCAQAVLNKFNNCDLPVIYEIPEISERLPAIEELKIATDTTVAQDIAYCVTREIQTEGYCNVVDFRPIMLSSLCVEALSVIYHMI